MKQPVFTILSKIGIAALAALLFKRLFFSIENLFEKDLILIFNNLSVLTSLVYKNQDKAVDFINELSKVYRYVLDNKSSELVSLEEELAFLEHYIYLLKIRFEDSITFTIKISKNTGGGYLPPMCLQMLVENTIQHNETSQANPLKVLIYTENNHLIVEKPISLKDVQFAIEKYKKQEQKVHKNLIENITTAYQQLNKQYKTRFLVKKGQTIESILTTDIHHFETEDSISFLTTTKGSRYPIDYTLDQLETMLEPKDFFRINRKIILHIQSIEKVNTYFNSRLSIATKFLDGDARLVSRDRVNDFKMWLDC